MSSPPQNQPGATQAGTPASGARGNGHDARQTAHELGEKAKVEGKARMDDLRETAAGNVDRLAEGVQAAASRLAQDDVGHMSQYISSLADGMGRFSGSLREKSGDELLRDIGRLARENPALFVTGSIAIGFGLGRFARASQPSASPTGDSATSADGTSTWSSQPGTAGMPASGLASSGATTPTGVAAGSTTAATASAQDTGPTADTRSASVSRPGTPGNPGPAPASGSTPPGNRGGTH